MEEASRVPHLFTFLLPFLVFFRVFRGSALVWNCAAGSIRGYIMFRGVAVFGVFLLVAQAAAAEKTVGDFKLSDPRDQKTIRFSELKEKKIIVAVFLGTQCPVANAFLLELARLHK